jgi:hypothetical protein
VLTLRERLIATGHPEAVAPARPRTHRVPRGPTVVLGCAVLAATLLWAVIRALGIE